MLAGVVATFAATSTALEFPQTILPPRQTHRPVSYTAPLFSEVSNSHTNTRENSISPNHQEPTTTDYYYPPLWKEKQKQSTSRRDSAEEILNNEQDSNVLYDWHVYVNVELEQESVSRKLTTTMQDSSSSSSSQPPLPRQLWNQVTSPAKQLVQALLLKSNDIANNTDSSHNQSTTNRRRGREALNQQEEEEQEDNDSSSSNATAYEVVNHANDTSDTLDDDGIDLYPYVNETELNITNGEYVDDDEYDFADDTGGGSQDQDSNYGSSNNNNGTSTSSTSLPRRFAPLRVRAILTDTLEEETGDVILNDTERHLLLMNMVRPAMVAWGEALRVRRVHGNLTLDPAQLVDGNFCGPGPTVQVPRDHVTFGIPDTDFVLYLHVARRQPDAPTPAPSSLQDYLNETVGDELDNITTPFQIGEADRVRWGFNRDEDGNGDEESASFDNTTAPTSSPIDAAYLCTGDYIAASAFCNTDQYDRPIAAILHLCLDDDFFKPERVDRNTRTIMHELGHSLGFNAISLAHFRRFDGSPRTPRLANGAVPLQSVKCTGPPLLDKGRRGDEAPDRRLRLGGPDTEPTQEPNKEEDQNERPPEPQGYYDSIPLPSEEILQFRVVRGGVRVAQIVTPSVLQVVRNHFGCQTLEGAELESGEHICLGDHWERRLFKTDLMNPIIDSDAVFSSRISTMTLAYFADSGWYQVDLSRASVASNWGRGAGCSFVEEPCIGQDGQVPPGLDSLFCSTRQMSASPSLDGCTHDILKKASCLMDQYTEQLPLVYQYFNGTLGSNVGGPDPFVDYCPYYAGFNNGLCSDQANEAFIKVSPLERLGSRNSRCLSGYFSYARTALCMRIACVVNDKTLRVQVDQTWKTCTHQGQILQTRIGMKVVCPDPVRTCPTFYCPRDCLGSPELVCDYSQGECVCPGNNTLPLPDGSCPKSADEDDGSNSDGGSGSSDSGESPSPFYRPPVNDQDPMIPGGDSPMSDIYFPNERALIEQIDEEDGRPRNWLLPIVGACLIVISVVFWMRRSRRRREALPVTTFDFPRDDDDDPNTTQRERPPSLGRRSDRRKMMATVAVNLHLQDQLSDVFVQDTNTDAASMTDTEGDRSFTASSVSRTNAPPLMPEEYLRPTIAIIPPPQQLEIECPVPRSRLRRRLRRRFLS